MQAEKALEVISTNDATIIGILIAVIIVIVVAFYKLWGTYQTLLVYVRDQEKANLELLWKVTNTVGDVSVFSKENGAKIDSVSGRITEILTTIKERLKDK